MSINFQSMKAKRTPFWLLLEEADPDIIIGCETWLHQGIHEREVLPAGYHMVARKDRQTDHHGGVMIATRTGINATEISLQTSTELAAASFDCPGKAPLVIGALYRPPSSDQNYMEELCSRIKDLSAHDPKATVWISGDINLPDIDWQTSTIRGNSNPIAVNQLLLDLIYDIGSEQIVNFPTRGQNTLDIFISNRPSLIERCKPLPGVSDHDVVFVQASTRVPRNKPPSRRIFLWKHAKTENLRDKISEFSKSFTDNNSPNSDINRLWDTFRNFCSEAISENVPSKMSSTRFSQPWITRSAKKLSRRKKRAFRRAKRSGKTEDAERYKRLQKDVKHECRKAYNTYVSDTVSNDKNSKKLYSFIKTTRCDSSGVSPLKSDGIAYSDPKIKANLLNNQFSSSFTAEDHSHLPSMDGDPYPEMPNFTITREGVKKLLQNLDPYKATGPDSIPSRFLKDFADEITPALTLIFRASLHQGEVPQDWRQAYVTPIFKKGDRSSPANYRPISLTSVCSKVMEHILHSQVMKHLEAHGILSDQQHGFRKRRSCESQLILTLQDLAAGMDEGQQIDAILLDFSKAFDKVPHERLAIKLKHYGIRGSLLQWIQSFLTDRKQQVLVEGQSSTTAPVVSGVPQGTVLGPLLFLLYINDLPQKVSSTARLFADDSLMYLKISSTKDTAALQLDLDRLQQWQSDWQMSFNPSKCEVVRVTKRKNPVEATYQIHGQDLTVAKTGKYLGVLISEDMSWKPHVDATIKKANNSLAFLRRNLSRCPQEVKAQCYKTLVRPITDYAASAWDPHTTTCIQQLEAVQRRAARFVNGDYHTKSSTSKMIQNLGWPSLQQRRQDAKLVMVYRITHGLVDIPASRFFHPTSSSTRGHPLRYMVPFCRTDVFLYSFFPSGIRLWNQLPESVVMSETLEDFKRGLASLH
ncbi:MAG: hypothetical protein JAZ03_24705 [Candidatus Thiodiazotropha taylori]|nr:hypothetical protein [Candidatus Thiodiazotropha taylori]MCW4337135.1 reverse transcriptase domain-containing protein [Candidatus Thiodiazotropha endolucinida]